MKYPHACNLRIYILHNERITHVLFQFVFVKLGGFCCENAKEVRRIAEIKQRNVRK